MENLRKIFLALFMCSTCLFANTETKVNPIKDESLIERMKTIETKIAQIDKTMEEILEFVGMKDLEVFID